ncbi:hypothetical protein ACIU1J_27555 [Azospirillum doebereinerae]|uniref:hypothetical protein n=1 Tax=Azospirillum doebereinerae TaxID=92933 RepID=UPI001EE5EA05|nr:hypothetical protein [Azospirillum doebereinerae]MCG5241377.1 hypothetical protein [Azospirillum doebereinerae]
MIPVNRNDAHAGHRHHQRFGEPLTAERKTAIFSSIESARANDNRSPAACLIRTACTNHGPREVWLVSVDGIVMQVVVPAPFLITVLPADARSKP